MYNSACYRRKPW